MTNNKRSQIIYGDSPFIEDIGVLTSLCLLHDEVLLFGGHYLDWELDYYRSNLADRDAAKSKLVEEMLQLLIPEGVISYHSPGTVDAKFPGSGTVEASGVEGFDVAEIGGE